MFCLVPGLSSQTIDMLAQVNADPLLRIVQNLPLSSITRLRTSSSYFNNFFAANRQRILDTQRVNVRVYFHLLHEADGHVDFYNLNEDTRAPSINFTIKYETGKKHHDTDFIVQLANGVELHKYSARHFVLWMAHDIEPATALSLLAGATFADLHFNEIVCTTHDGFIDLARLGDVMDLHAVRIKFDLSVLPEEQPFLSMVNQLHVEHMEMVLEKAEEFGPVERHIDSVTDLVLAHLDSFHNNDRATRITRDGVLNWIRWKLQEGRFGDHLCVKLVFEHAAELADSLDAEVIPSTDARSKGFTESVHYIRGANGKSIKATLSGAETQFSVCYSYEDHFFGTVACKRFLPPYPKAIELVSGEEEGAETRILMGNEEEKDRLVFHITHHEPGRSEWRIVDNLTSNIYVFEKKAKSCESDFRSFLVHTPFEKSEQETQRVVCLLGTKFRNFMSHDASCIGASSDNVLGYLLAYGQGVGRHLRFPCLILSGAGNGPSESLLQKVIVDQQVKKLVCESRDLDLSTEFFANTPSLTNFRASTQVNGHFGVNDDLLERFENFSTEKTTAETQISWVGVAAWCRRQERRFKHWSGVDMNKDDKIWSLSVPSSLWSNEDELRERLEELFIDFRHESFDLSQDSATEVFKDRVPFLKVIFRREPLGLRLQYNRFSKAQFCLSNLSFYG